MKKRYLSSFVVLLVVTLLSIFAAPAMAEGTRYTRLTKPIGPVDDESVLSIPEGSYIHHMANGVTEVYNQNGEKILV